MGRGGGVVAMLLAVWWQPLLALAALFLSRVGLSTRAYCLVFGRDWYVVSNGGFCRLRLAPRR